MCLPGNAFSHPHGPCAGRNGDNYANAIKTAIASPEARTAIIGQGLMVMGKGRMACIPSHAGKAGAGEVGVELAIRGASIRPGDFIAMDQDEVVVTSGPFTG